MTLPLLCLWHISAAALKLTFLGFACRQSESTELKSIKTKPPRRDSLLIEMEARAGVEPTYTDLHSGA